MASPAKEALFLRHSSLSVSFQEGLKTGFALHTRKGWRKNEYVHIKQARSGQLC